MIVQVNSGSSKITLFHLLPRILLCHCSHSSSLPMVFLLFCNSAESEITFLKMAFLRPKPERAYIFVSCIMFQAHTRNLIFFFLRPTCRASCTICLRTNLPKILNFSLVRGPKNLTLRHYRMCVRVCIKSTHFLRFTRTSSWSKPANTKKTPGTFGR